MLANHSEGLARILEGVTGLQMELMETKLRVNNMAARMGINTRTCHVQTHISYQPSNRLRLQNLNDEGDMAGAFPTRRYRLLTPGLQSRFRGKAPILTGVSRWRGPAAAAGLRGAGGHSAGSPSDRRSAAAVPVDRQLADVTLRMSVK